MKGHSQWLIPKCRGDVEIGREGDRQTTYRRWSCHPNLMCRNFIRTILRFGWSLRNAVKFKQHPGEGNISVVTLYFCQLCLASCGSSICRKTGRWDFLSRITRSTSLCNNFTTEECVWNQSAGKTGNSHFQTLLCVKYCFTSTEFPSLPLCSLPSLFQPLNIFIYTRWKLLFTSYSWSLFCVVAVAVNWNTVCNETKTNWMLSHLAENVPPNTEKSQEAGKTGNKTNEYWNSTRIRIRISNGFIAK